MKISTFPRDVPVAHFHRRSFFGGLVVGLIALAWLGAVSPNGQHPHFTRFHSAISPSGNYYPTLREMSALVRSQCRRDQVLVIVGGNSILRGSGQPAGEQWTVELQRQLGSRFCVVNLAFDGIAPMQGGAIVAESMRNEFPSQILITNSWPAVTGDLLGADRYRYLLWEAYFGGNLIPWGPRSARIQEILLEPSNVGNALQLCLATTVDRGLHFRDFWNRVSLDYFFTIPNSQTWSIGTLWRPRGSFPDPEPDATQVTASRRFSGPVPDLTADKFFLDQNDEWQLSPAAESKLSVYCRAIFPDSLKARTLMVLGWDSPQARLTTPFEHGRREQKVISESLRLWRNAGVGSMEYGRDFVDDDFSDHIHLTKWGGRKLARSVAPEVRSIATKLGYLGRP